MDKAISFYTAIGFEVKSVGKIIMQSYSCREWFLVCIQRQKYI